MWSLVAMFGHRDLDNSLDIKKLLCCNLKCSLEFVPMKMIFYVKVLLLLIFKIMKLKQNL